MKLDSLAYRCLWKLKKLVGIYPGPMPIIWKKTEHNLYPPTDFVSHLDEKQKENLRQFQREVEVLSQFYNYFPSKFTQKQWNELVNMDDLNERFNFLKFVKKVEREKEADKRQKMERIPAVKAESIERVNYLGYVHPDYMDQIMRESQTMRMVQAFWFEDRPKIVVDCRFLQEHTARGKNLTFLQLSLLLTQNKRRLHPWPVVLANFDESRKVISEGLNIHLAQLKTKDCFVGEYTSKSYLDLYEAERLIYLSPHAEEKLTTDEVMDERNVFIIGGIVDRVPEPNIHPQASLVCAQEEGIKCRKLPLDDYMQWKAGHKLLTLTSVIKIIQDVFDTQGDWQTALERTIPIRNKTTMGERNPNMKRRIENTRVYHREIYRLLRENL